MTDNTLQQQDHYQSQLRIELALKEIALVKDRAADTENIYYEIDAGVDPANWLDELDRSDWPRPNAGYGSSFTTWDDLVSYWDHGMHLTAEEIERLGTSDELTDRVLRLAQDRGLIAYEPAANGFVCSHQFYLSEIDDRLEKKWTYVGGGQGSVFLTLLKEIDELSTEQPLTN